FSRDWSSDVCSSDLDRDSAVRSACTDCGDDPIGEGKRGARCLHAGLERSVPNNFPASQIGPTVSANRTERNVLFDVRGAAVDEESRAFAASLLKAWGAEPPRFSLSLRGSGNLGSAAPESLIRTAQSGVPNVVLATWPVWPAKSAVPVVLFVGHGADRLKSM